VRPLDLRGVRAAAVDLDGTLVRLSIDYDALRGRVRALLADAGDADPGELRPLLAGIDAAARRLGRPDVRDRALALIDEAETRAAADATLLPGAREAMLALAERKVRLAIFSRTCRAAVLACLERFAFPPMEVVAREDVARPKPHPEALLRLQRAFDVPAAALLVVGDHVYDAQAARAAGCPCVAVPTGVSTRAALAAEGALVLDTLDRLPELLS